LLVGLTGGVASGKTTVANYLQTLGAYVIDTDAIARQVVKPRAPIMPHLRQLLGDGYFLGDGNLDRAKVKKLIFADRMIKERYEAIILPAIRQSTLQSIEHIPKDVCYGVLIVPLLFEKGLYHYTNVNVVVDIPEDLQIARAIKRNAQDAAVIKAIIASQMPRRERCRRADFIIDNGHCLEKCYQQLDELHNTLCALSPNTRQKNGD